MVVRWIPVHVLFLALPFWAGLSATGAFRALYNFLLPVNHLGFAFAAVLVPAFVRARDEPRFKTRVRILTGVFLLGGIGYWLRRPLIWDPEREQFADDAEANRLLHREPRKPWTYG